jgi:preprotein translocase subunit SecA
MITTYLAKVFGTQHEREMKRIQPIVDAINSWEPKMKALSDAELQQQTPKFKERIAKGETLDQILPEAFAVCREASSRVLGMRHYDVQMIGGITLHRGSIAEMKTGEGKTLVATLAVYLNALEGKGAHVVTVNDYLASRDAEWMGKLYSWLGLKTGVVKHGQSDEEKQEAYNADITYATNNELGFDYLRDNMKFDLIEYCQRPLNFAIVDECDSILIDEARTPLIISGAAEDAVDKYYTINSIIPHLKKEIDFTMEEKSRTVSLTEDGNTTCEQLLKIGNLYDPEHIALLHHIYQGLKAHHLYHKDVDYMVKDDEVIIVDEFTGRLMEGRRWSDGLHQAVEAKENVKVKNENQTLATITFQNLFRMYKKLSGMTGTAETEAVEMKKIYNLDVSVIPTNRPIQRADNQDLIYKNSNGKYNAIIQDIIERQKNGQPVLVGTVSIERSEHISTYLKRAGIPHNVLNAKAHEREAEIVAQAGRKGSVTIATNMAGRGTDIVLGGNPEGLARHKIKDHESVEFHAAVEDFKKMCEAEKKEVISAGGLMIIGTERHESRRIDNQLRGRSGRQGDPGASRFYLALDDDLMRKFNGEKIQKLMNAMNMPEDEPITARMVSSSIEGAQRKVEGHNFDIRKHLLEYDDVMNKQRIVIYGLRKDVLLGGDRLDQIIVEMLSDVTGYILDTYADERTKPEQWNLAGLSTAIGAQFGLHIDFTGQTIHTAHDLTEIVKTAIKKVFEEQKARLGPYFKQVEKMILLQTIDQRWKDHLQSIDQLREWINLRAYAQKDPLVEYKQEAFKKFEEMNFAIKAEVIEKFIKIQLVVNQDQSTPPSELESNHEEDEEIEEEEDFGDNSTDVALQALQPKKKQRLIYSGGGDESSGASNVSRNDRRKIEAKKKKKRF